MIRQIFHPGLIHLKVRAKASLRSPVAWIVLLAFGLTGSIYWPTVLGTFNPLVDSNEGLPLVLVWILWYWLWLATPVMVVRGRAAIRRGEAPLGICAAPALPVGLRTRAVAEAFFVLTIMAAVRWVTVSVYQGLWTWSSMLSTVAGAVFLFPMAVAWALPVKNTSGFMARPLMVAVLAGFLNRFAGVFDTRLRIVLAGISLTVVALLIANIEVPELKRRFGRTNAANRSRKGADPGRQLALDAMGLPLRAWGLWVFITIVIYGICLLLEVRGNSWEWILFAGFEAFLIIALQPLFRPFNSNLLAESLVGKHQVSRGDFMQAWSVLPVRREAVLRKVWIHGLVGGLILWAVPVMILVVRHFLIGGRWSFVEGFGDLMQFVVVGGLLVPVMAGFMVGVASGRKLEYALSGLCLLLGVHVLFLVKVLLREFFGPASAVAAAGPVLMLVLLVVVGALPPLRFLHKAPEPL